MFIPAQAKRVGVSNFHVRKNPHTPEYGVKEFVRLSFTKDDFVFILTRTKNN